MLTGGEFSPAIGKSGSCGGAEAPRRPRAAVFVSGGGTNLQALLDKRGSVIKSGDIALVVSNKPDAFALQRAKNAGIEAVYLPQNRQDPALFETAARKLLKERKIDVVVLAGFLAILSADLPKVTTGASSTFIRHSFRPSAERGTTVCAFTRLRLHTA